jgi:D-3-phosphoglycerate dehydrogenase
MNQHDFRILNLEPQGYSAEAKMVLDEIGVVDSGPLSRKELLTAIPYYEILIVRLAHRIDEELLRKANKLKVIATATTGLNHIDLNCAKGLGIEVLSLRGEIEFLNDIHATAEHTWALLLSLVRKLPQAHAHVLNGEWSRDLFIGSELHGKTLGVIGLGRLGIKVAQYGLAFGMKVLANDIISPKIIPAGVDMVTLPELLTGSDVICLHASYSVSNRNMIGKLQTSQMKRGCIFINTARGELVDEEELLNAIQNQHISGAAVDVLAGENDCWTSSGKFLNLAKSHHNLLITPHIGGATREAMVKTEIFMANKLLRYINELR